MANEAVIIELLGNGGDVLQYTVGDASAVEKGAILWFSDPRTLSGSSIATAALQPIAGIASAEKVASDGSTRLGVYTNGVFDLKCDSVVTINAGDYVTLTGQNLITNISAAGGNSYLSGARVLGYALETASASEVIAVRVKL